MITINQITIAAKTISNLPENAELRPRARELRYAHNLPEVLFWLQVHKNAFHRIDFDRQRIIGNYIVDFYSRSLGLVVEIDGGGHDHNGEYDERRDKYLESLGLKVYRIQATDILYHMDFALIGLENYIIEHYGI